MTLDDVELDPVTGRPVPGGPTREHRIVGPPGTGKTYELARYAARGADLYGSDAVAIASLTKAAAQEIADRVYDGGVDRVGTLHAHAYRGLEQPALAETPDGLRDWNVHVGDVAPTLRLRVGGGLDDGLDFTDGALSSTATEGEQLLADLNARRARMEDPATWPARVAQFADRWNAWKARAGRRDFTDLIELAVDDLPACPGDPAVLLVDEAQDLSLLEFTLARQWGAQATEFIVSGDPDQNLYAWRGADPDAFWHDGAASERVLERSRRVPAAVQAYALDWIRRIPDRRDVTYFPRLADPDDASTPVVAGAVTALPDRATFAQPDPLLPHLARDLDDGRTVMVLASCSYMLEPIARALRDRGIPYHNPYRPKNGAWNPLRGAERIRAFLRPTPVDQGGEGRMWTWDDVRLWLEPVKAKGNLAHGAKALVDWYSAPGRFDADEAPPADLPKLLDLLADEARDPVLDLDLGWWQRALLESHARRYAYPCAVARLRGPEALRDAPRLILGTIHSVKGGEADHVYLAPDLSRAAALQGRHQPAHPTPATVRLFYVAMTRARETLTVLEPAGGDYAALPRPGGGGLVHRRGGKRLAQLARQTLDQQGGTA